jgi:ABC-type sugar transport system substrate-binding protein
MKRLLAIAATLMVLFSCSTGQNVNEISSSFSFKIGFPSSDSGGAFIENYKRVIEAAGGELIVEACDNSPLSVITAINKLISVKCDGIIVMPTSESILPQISELCEEAKVFWAITLRPVFNLQIQELLQDSEYFVGMVRENDEEVAYDFMKLLFENGKRHIALVSTVSADPVQVAREQGVYRASEEFGMEIVTNINNVTTPEETYNAISNLLIARPDIDAVFRVSGHFSNHKEIIQAVEDAGKGDSIKFVTIDFYKAGEESLDKKILLVMAGGHKPINAALSSAILVNAILDPATFKPKHDYVINYLIINTSEELSQYKQFYSERNEMLFFFFFSRRAVFISQDHSLSAADYNKIIDAYTMETIRLINQKSSDLENPFD